MMSEQQFDARLTVIEDQAGSKQERVDGYRDQKIAALFVESGWTQEELAAHLSKKWKKNVDRSWVSRHLLLGRLLQFFVTTWHKEWRLSTHFTEGTFRRLWEETEANGDFRGHKAASKAAKEDEQRRFGLVLEEMKAQGICTRKAKKVRDPIIEHIAGKQQWLTIKEMAEKISSEKGEPFSAESVQNCLIRYIKPDDKFPYRLEKSARGEETTYRIVKVKGKIINRKQMQAYSHEVIPMMDELIREAQKDRTAISLSRLSELASKIKGVLQSITSEVPST